MEYFSIVARHPALLTIDETHCENPVECVRRECLQFPRIAPVCGADNCIPLTGNPPSLIIDENETVEISGCAGLDGLPVVSSIRSMEDASGMSDNPAI
jgi:hypothetical protein